MSEPPRAEAQDLRCSTYSRVHHVDPIGSAGSYAGYLLVEWPAPWPVDIGEVSELAPLVALVAARRWRLQGLLAREGAPRRLVIAYAAPSGPFQAFARRELEVAPAEVVEAARSLLEEAGTGVWPDPATIDGQDVHDVLVCSHGRRDRCCGSLGTMLAEQLGAQLGAGERGAPTGGVRVWRTSHTGGHRFAPTGLVLPEGTMWGYLDDGRLRAVLGRREPASLVLDGYRGCAGLPARELQVLERAALAELGWEVLDARRSGHVEAPVAQGTVREGGSGADSAWSKATLELAWDDGRRARYRAEVGVGRVLPIPDCGSALETSVKVERELGLRHLRRL